MLRTNDIQKWSWALFFFGLVVGLMGSTLVKAETLSWEPPTSRVDGQPLDPATELSEYRFYCAEVTTSIPATSTNGEYEIDKAQSLPGYGTFDCYLTAVDTEDRESQPSNTVALIWEPTAPNAPTTLLIIK